MDDKKLAERNRSTGVDETLREQAVIELRKRRDLAGHVLAYLTVNTFLVVIWYLTGAGSSGRPSRCSAGASA
ncbi:hypothetical protein [Kribbella sp. NBC_00889]|uniref:hypothetical protein n=1 Tax=Kribbella sp. NBC_00889 TaxID=2975974 RepID=UPI00386E2F09|nr:2TM domain-containing protein [Kribbella sp. NBC_00889]